VLVTRDENDLFAAAPRLELFLQTEPVQSRHPHIENQAGWAFEKFPGQIVFRGSKGLCRVTGGFEQTEQTAAHRLSVVYDPDQFRRRAHATSRDSEDRIAGRQKENRAPSPVFSACNFPPCASTIERTMVRPMPIPFG